MVTFYFLEKNSSRKELQPDLSQVRGPNATGDRAGMSLLSSLVFWKWLLALFMLSLHMGMLINMQTNAENTLSLPQVSPHNAICFSCFCIDMTGLGVLGGMRATCYPFLFLNILYSQMSLQ